jgi:hypothetical protein
MRLAADDGAAAGRIGFPEKCIPHFLLPDATYHLLPLALPRAANGLVGAGPNL